MLLLHKPQPLKAHQRRQPLRAGSVDFTTNGGTVGGDVTVSGDISVTGNVDGRDVAADGTKLDGIETGATADQTDAEIKTAYENNSDTNAFTDAPTD